MDEILELISLKQEGAYWDFKRAWHDSNMDLLHDIICLANNLVNRDCYIIIGVDEETDYSICDVSDDPNRKNTQKLVDFLKDKEFAGGIRPTVLVKSYHIKSSTIDVIVIKNTFDTPYYLIESYQGVFKNNIYTRVMDTNTPKNKSADIDKVEYLWKKRFRLLESPLARVEYLLKAPENWSKSPIESTDTMYYTYAPEYRIVSVEDEHRNGYEYYLFSQTDPRPHWYYTHIFYYSTILESFLEIAMDGGRWRAIAPNRSAINENSNHFFECKAYYGYYIRDSLRYHLHLFLAGDDKDSYDYSEYMSVILLFDNDDERIQFENYVLQNLDEFDKVFVEQKTPYIEPIPGYNICEIEKQYKAALALQIMLLKFRCDISDITSEGK